MAKKNLFLQSPDAGDIEEIFANGADALTSAAPIQPSATAAPKQVQQAPQDSAPRRPAPTRDDIIRRAQELDIDPAIPLAIWGVESGSNFNSRDSYKGAVGGMQVMPDTYKMMMGSYSGQRDPWNNMEAGLRYIAYGQKTLGTKDPALLAAGYHAGYDRKDLKEGRIPQNIGDGLMKTSDYAAKVAGKVGLGGSTPNLQQQLDKEEPGRYQVLTEEEAANYQRKNLQSSLDSEEAGRYQVLTPEELKVYEAGNAPAVKPPVQTQGGIGSTLLDIGKMGLGGVYKGVGQVLGGVGEAVAMLGDYTTTPLINKALGTNYRTGNLLEKPADWYKKGGEGLQASISKESLEAVRDSSPDGDLFKPSTWTFGKAPSLRGYAMLGADVLGSMAPVVAASVASGGSAVVGGVVGGAQGGGAAASTARETIDKMVKDGTIADQSAYYRELIAAGKSPQEAAQLTQDAAAQWSLLLTAPVSAAGGALTSKIVDPATKIVASGSLPARIAGRGAIGGLEEGVQEATETVQTQSGINRGAGTNLSVTEGTFGDFVLGALGGGVTGGGAGAMSSRDTSGKVQQAKQPAQPRQDPTIDVTYPDGQGNTVTEVVPGAPAQPEAAAQPAPKATGPIGRAMEKAAPAAPVQEAAPTPEVAAEPELPRVRITAENGQTMTGFAEQLGEDGSGRVLGDDGQVYQFTADDGVTITIEGQAKAPRDEPEAQPAATENEAESEQQQPEASAQDAEAEAEQAQEAPNSEAQASATDNANKQPAQDTQAPAATETEAADRPLTEWSEQELRERLRYVTQQAKNNGGWDKRLTTIKREVSAEIDRRNQEAKNDQQPATAAVPDANVAPASDQAAAPVAGDQPTRGAPTEVDAVRADGVQDAARATELPVGEAVSGADAAAKPDAALTAERDPHAGKWFGSREKADAYLAKKKAAGTHEIVQTGKVRFEIKPKAQSVEAQQNVYPGNTEKAPTATESLAENAKNTAVQAQVEQPTKVEASDLSGLDKRIAEVQQRLDTLRKNQKDAEAVGNAWTWDKKIADAESTLAAYQQARANIAGVQQSDADLDAMFDDAVAAKKQADAKAAPVAPKAKKQPAPAARKEPRQGSVGMKLEAGEQVRTSSGRETTPFPKIDTTSKGKTTNTFKRVDQWLMQNALDEATARGDDFNARQFEANKDKPSQADKDSAEEYLFGEQPAVVPSILRPLGSAAKNTAAGLTAAIDGLGELFGGTGKLNSGLTFDEETYAKAKPLFKQAISHLGEAGRDLRQAMQAIVNMVMDKFGEETTQRMKPYVVQFVKDVRDGKEQVGEATAESQNDGVAKPAQPATIAPKEAAQDDRQATDGAADQGTPNQSAAEVRADEGSGDAGPVPAKPAGADAGSDQRGAPGRDQQRSERGQPGVPAEPAGSDTGNQQRTKGGRGSGNRAGDGADRGAASRVGNDYRINPEELKRTGSWKATAEQNVRIVELVKQLEKEGRRPTADEAALLTKFTGWGASEIANGIFPDRWGRYKPGWEELGQRLKAVLTEEEYAQASRTTQYAHYTSPQVIGSIYDGLRRLGFGGGKVLEPGMGIGLFKGLMPANVAAASQYTGVEYDSITGAIAKLLYPESNIIVGDFTKTGMPRDFFDAAIGNPPFSSTVISNDPEYKKQGFMLHDYFFAKTIDRVKPGGLLVFVTSKGTMDKGTDRARKYLGERANLLGAIRLPQTAFKDNAGTEVVTDVIFLQKRGDGIPDNGVKWMGTAEVQTPQGPAQINEYFAAHPEMVLGTNALTGSMYRANEYTVIPEPGVDMDEAFAKAIQNLPEAVYKPGTKNPAAAAAVAVEREFNPSHKKEGGLYVNDKGTLMQVDSGSGVELTHRRGSDGKQIALKPADKAFLKSWVGLRDALKQAQLDQLTDGNWEKSLKALGKAYDAFVKQHGNLLAYSAIERTAEDGTVTVTKRFKNDPLLRLDVDGALAYSLEHIKESGEIVKAPVLTGRVLEKKRPPEIKTTQDALFVSLNELGSLDMDHVAKLAGMSRDAVIEALGNEIYEAPGAGWQTADAYLSGNVVRKLKEAQAAARSDKRYQRNIDALLAVQPKPLGPTEITVKLGQNWVPASDIAAFARESLGENIDVSYNARLGSWTADQNGSNYTEFNTPKMDAGKILDSVLNNRQIKITWRDDEGKTHVDAEATEKANDVARKMREQFSRWIWKDAKRADRLVNYYNEHFNNIAPRQFDGSHLTLPGVSLRFNLYPHQKRAIWRMIQEGDTYLAHAVGAGKTFTMIAAGMEERRLGLSNKPMYVVPNHMLAQFAREFLELYPAANIMVADEQNFHTHNRRRFVAQAALNNPDAIIITHSAFGRIGMSDEFASQFISDQIDEWKMALEETDKSDRITRKQIERRIEQLERRLEARQGKDKKDAVLAFEELGVDRLFVDEAHEFRKLDFATNQGNIKGIDPAGSQRAMDLFMKATYLRGKKPGRALVAASGTPVTNTMGELFTVQRLFQPDQLEEDGLDTFDAWANQYGDVVAGFEQNAAGGYEVVSRFAKFQNVPELMRRVRSFMDILTSANLGELVQRPAVDGGGRQVVVTPEPDGYRAYQKTLESRINAIRNRKGPPKKGEDIILKVIADGRFSAIDMRFVDPSLPSDPKSKLNQAIDGLIEAYNATADNEYMTNGKPDPIKGASLILFTDIGLGEQSAESRGFDMKAWIEKRLIEAGIPREHIAFMRDHKEHAKKERLFADMREGKKRILIGGKDMETGVNVQKRLAYLAHLDAPWFPASVEQREGRIVRQGNQNKNVRVEAFATKGSYDSTMWGMNGRKARFIEQAMNGDYSVRTMEDVSEASAFEMAAALASGDERYMKLAGLKSDIDRLERLRHAHYDDQNKLRRDKHWAETSIERDQKFVADLDAAIAKRTPIRAGEFAGKVGKVSYTNRDEFSSAIFNRTKELAAENFDGEQQIGEIGGFPITYFGVNGKGSGSYGASVEVMIPGDPSPLLSVPLDPDTAVAGIATRAANQVNSLDRMKAESAERIATNKRRAEQIGQRLGAPFPEEADLMEKVAALNSLEAELTAEKAKEGAEAVTADAAAATMEVEEGAKFSLIDQTQTPAFKRWFGDSKVVDADGNPLVVYHGTTSEFTEFKPSKKFGDAYFASQDVAYANTFAGTVDEADFKFQEDGGNVIPLYASIQNPMVVDYADYDANTLEYFLSSSNDGLIAWSGDVAKVVIVRNSNQLKSAIGNNGNFDPASPDIRYSIAPGIDRTQSVPVASIKSFDVAPEELYATANEWFRENLTGVKVRNESLDADVSFSRLGRSKLTSVGRRDARRMSVVQALPELVKNGVLVAEEGDRKGRDGLDGYATIVAPVEIDGSTYSFIVKLRREDRKNDPATIFYTVAAFSLVEKSGPSRDSTTQQGQDRSSTRSSLEGGYSGNVDVQSTPASAPGRTPSETMATSRASTTRIPQDRPSTGRLPDADSADVRSVSRPGDSAAQRRSITVGELLDAINEANRAFSLTASPAVDGIVMSDASNGNAMSANVLRKSLESGALGGVFADLLARGSVVLHDTAASLPGKKAPVGTQAVTMPDGKIHLVADMLTASTAQPVLLHEAFHGGAQKLIGTTAWDGLMKRLGSIHRQAEQSSGRAREFYDAARARVAAAKRTGTLPDSLTAEEFGAYTIEQYELAPPAFRKWVDDVIGAIKAWLLRRFGVQAGKVTPAQLRALAVAALRAGAVQQDGPRYSISEDQKGKAVDAAMNELDDAPQEDRIGRVVNDVSMGARLFVHPRTIAAIHPEFTPVYNTAISQMETRDKNIAELGRGVESYNALTTEQKANVNKVLELGRLVSATYDAQALADGVTNKGYKQTVRVGEDGKPRPVREPIKALLTAPGEVVQLSEAEIKAYTDLRGMFDQALDKFRDQTLEEFGFPELVGQPDPAKALDKMASDSKNDAERERFKNIANFIREIEQAKRTGYVPFARYGDYVVTVKEKIADLEFEPDGDDAYMVRGVPAEWETEMLELQALPEGDGWLVPKANRAAVARLAEKTVYSAKVETGLNDFFAKGKGAQKVDELPSVKAAIEQARKEWVGDNPNRSIVAFRVRDKQPDSAVKLTDVDALAEIANIDNATWDAVRDKLATAIQGRSFRKHFFHSDNVPGYTGDFERAIADYVIGMSGYLSRRAHQKRWDNAINRITEKGKLHQYATKYRDYVNEPQEEFAAVRQIGFFSYIAGVMATAFANMTQVPLLTVPTLAQVAPPPLVMSELTRAYKDAFAMLSRGKGLDLFDPKKAPQDVRAALMEAWDEGAFVPLETFDMMMTARQRNVGRRKLVKGFNDATKAVSIAFTFAERLNRLVTFIAAARLAAKEGVRKNANARLSNDSLARSTVLGRNWTPKNFAEWVVDESQYRMGKANRPTTMRGVGAALMQFKGFMLQTFEAWYRMAALHGPEGKYAAAASLLALYALAGVWGMPGADDLRKLIEAAYKAITDKDLDMKTELRAWVARTSGSNVLAQAVTKGASYPLGVDLTRVGMGTVVPDSPLAAAGIPFDILIGRPKRAFEKGSTGDYAGAAAEFMPNFAKHWLVAGGWALDGVRDKNGQRIMAADQLSKTDIAMKTMGFQPSIITDVRDYEYAQRRQETAVDTLKRKYAAQIARTLVAMERAEEGGDIKKLEKLDAELTETYAKLDAHNADAKPEAQIKIDMRTVRQRMQRERDGVMATWGKERKAAREGAEDLRGLFGLSGENGENEGE